MFLHRKTQHIDLPPFGKYATGIFYLDKSHHQKMEEKFGVLAESLKISVLCWRTVPTNNATIGTYDPATESCFVTSLSVTVVVYKIEGEVIVDLSAVCLYIISDTFLLVGLWRITFHSSSSLIW